MHKSTIKSACIRFGVKLIKKEREKNLFHYYHRLRSFVCALTGITIGSGCCRDLLRLKLEQKMYARTIEKSTRKNSGKLIFLVAPIITIDVTRMESNTEKNDNEIEPTKLKLKREKDEKKKFKIRTRRPDAPQI